MFLILKKTDFLQTDICTTAESQLASFCNPSDKVKKKMEEELSERILKEQDYKIICNAKDTETECEVFSEVKSPVSFDCKIIFNNWVQAHTSFITFNEPYCGKF